MPAKEVIHFPFSAQLTSRSLLPALFPPEPVSESPPELSPTCVSRVRSNSRPSRYPCAPTLLSTTGLRRSSREHKRRFKCKKPISTKQFCW
jgi:hypothetical protein